MSHILDTIRVPAKAGTGIMLSPGMAIPAEGS